MINSDTCVRARSMVRVLRGLIAATVTAAALCLGGCIQQPSRAHVAPANGEGGVLLKVLENLPIRNDVFWGQVTVRRVPDASDSSIRCYALRVNFLGQSAGSWWGGALPEGTYEFPAIGAGEKPEGECNKRYLVAPHESRFGRFVITPGHLTYLGVIAQTGGRDQYNSLMIPVFGGKQEDIGEILRESFPELGALEVRSLAGWKDSTLPAAQEAVTQYALDNAYGLLGPSQAPDGAWIFGSRVGVVRSWHRGQSQAESHYTGYNVALVATAVLPDGSWLAAGDESTLLRSADGGVDWRSVRGDLPFGQIAHVVAIGSEVLLTLVRENDVLIYRGDVRSGHWKQVASHRLEFAVWTGMRNVRPESALIGDTYVTTLPSKRLALYHVSTGTSEERGLPGSVMAFSASDDGVLRCRCTASFAFSPYESHDFGKTWQSSDFPRFMTLPFMVDASHGATAYQSGAFDRPTMAYTDDGRSWQRGVDAPRGLNHFFRSRDGQFIYVSDEAGLLWESNDVGRYWELALHVTLPAGDEVFP